MSHAATPAGPLPRGAADGASHTKDRLLDAAELLFAERGFDGASLRALTQAAGTSVSAAHYHFGSKEALLRAVLWRRIGPMNAQRLARLDGLEAEAPGRPLAIEQVVDAFLTPLFEGSGSDPGAARFVAARLYSDPPELVTVLKRELFGELSNRFVTALHRALPDCSRDEVGLRFQFAVGVMVHVMSGSLPESPHLNALADDPLLAPESVRRHMIAFVSAGLRAPAREDPS